MKFVAKILKSRGKENKERKGVAGNNFVKYKNNFIHNGPHQG